jgi:protein-disulfide isomerase
MRRYLPIVIVVVVGIVALASGAVLYRAKRPPILTISNELSAKKSDIQSQHVRGNPDAPVTVEEFGDYQCPPCGTLAEPINQLEKEFRPQVRLIFYNFPLITHQHARTAACAAEAAGLQGKFWEMHDLLYREQPNWSKSAEAGSLFNSYAGILGLDLERFKKDMQSDAVKSRVDADQKRGTSIGVQNTPTVFLNNRAISPADLPPERLHATVAAAVKTASGGNPSEARDLKK